MTANMKAAGNVTTKKRIVQILTDGSGLAVSISILLVMMAICLIFVPRVYQWENLTNILRIYAPGGIVVIGLSMVLFTGEIDISVGAIMSLAMSVAAQVMDWNEPLALVLICVTGLVAGFINGALVVVTKVPSLMITLGMTSVYSGLAAMLVKAQPKYISTLHPIMNYMSKENFLGLPIPFVICLVLALTLWFVSTKTAFGRRMFYLGTNKRSAWMSGINIDRTRVFYFTLCGLLSAIAGPLLAAQLGGAQITMGTGYEVTAISIAVVGGVSLSGGRGSVLGTLCGLFTMGLLLNALALSGMGTYVATTLRGIMIIGIVFLYGFIRSRAR